MASYNKTYSDDVMAKLTGYDLNPSEQIGNLPPDIRDNFYNEFAETLLSQDYDSDTVIKESLKRTSDEYFKSVNWQTKRAIENDFKLNGADYTLAKWEDRIAAGDYVTLDENILYDFVDTLQIMDNLEFY